MDGLNLLRQARQAGLQVTATGNLLVVQGPSRLEAIARALLAQKPTVLDALSQEREIGWRIDAMRPQITATGAIPPLMARPGAPWTTGRCCSCGDPLAADDRYRCRPCVAAVVAVLDGVP